MLNKFVGQVISIVIRNAFNLVVAIGTLDAVVGEDCYILRVKDTDMTIRFRAYKIIEITELHGITVIYLGLNS